MQFLWIKPIKDIDTICGWQNWFLHRLTYVLRLSATNRPGCLPGQNALNHHKERTCSSVHWSGLKAIWISLVWVFICICRYSPSAHIIGALSWTRPAMTCVYTCVLCTLYTCTLPATTTGPCVLTSDTFSTATHGSATGVKRGLRLRKTTKKVPLHVFLCKSGP